MKKLLVLMIMLSVVQFATSSGLIFNRLSSDEQAKKLMNTGDFILSTLGYYKAVLEQSFCQLTIHQYSQQDQKYYAVDSYKNSLISSCKSIKIEKNQILTDEGKILAELPQSNYSKTYLTVDDVGTIRFIGIKASNFETSNSNTEEIILFVLNLSKIKYQNFKSYDQIKMEQLNITYINDKKWMFRFEDNYLTISKQNNATLFSKFNLEKIALNKSGNYQVNGTSYPFIFSSNAFLQPKCDLRKVGCQVRAPYTIQMNRYWPVVRIFDQEKYLIAEYSLLKTNQVLPASICPSGSFLYKDSCVKSCPAVYYEHISVNVGQCVLACPQGSVIDKLNRRCSCSEKDLFDNQEDKKKVKKCQKDWNATFFGCDCLSSDFFYDRVNTLSCQLTCPAKTLSENGVCYQCPSNCKSCLRDQNYLFFASCNSCDSGFKLQNGKCIKEKSNCSLNCDQCDSAQCLKCSTFYALHQGKCLASCPSGFVQTFDEKNGSSCIDNSLTPIKPCPTGCLKCKDDICLLCASKYIMFVSPLATTCKIKNLNTKCPSGYIYESKRQICYYSDLDGMNMGQCKQKINHCQICQTGSQDTCIVCQQGYFLSNNQCVQRCPSGSLKFNNICIEQIKNCQTQTAQVSQSTGEINFDLMKTSTSYKRQIFNGLQPGNDVRGYEIYMKQFVLKESTNNASYSTTVRSSEMICSKCRKGYGLSDDKKKCIACPSSCDSGYCYLATQESCYKPTIKCTYLDENGLCMESCPQGRYPQSDSNNVLKCLPSSVSSVNDYLKIDSSYYLQGDGTKIFYFVLDKPVQNGSTPLSARLLFATNTNKINGLQGNHQDQSASSSHRRVLVSTQDVLLLQKGQYYSVRNTEQNAVAISFEQNINQFRTPFGFTLANTIYGAQADYTHSQWMKEWLAHIGYVMSWVILLVHCIYVGNTILYKVDNLIIFGQTIYLFTFVKLLVGNNLAQYYYGWFWMHMGFFPNYFKYTVPNQYDETNAPLPFKLATLDGNFIRNAGYAVSLFITFLVAWALLSLCAYLVNKILKRSQIWYQGIAKNSLISGTELLSMIIFFFSVTQLLYDDVYPESGSDFHHSNVGASIFFIVIISVYTLIRTYFNPIGGLYMFKRLAIALILVAAYSREGFLALLISVQVCFSLIIYLLEKPRLLREKVFMLAECACFILAYILLFLVTVPGVNVLIITVIIFALLLFLIADLIDLYMEARNQLYQFDLFGAKYDNQSHQQDQVPESERKMNTQ